VHGGTHGNSDPAGAGPAERATAGHHRPSSEAARLIEACGDLGVDGIVMKRLGSPYRPGERSSDWRKLKVEGWAAEHMPRRSSDERWKTSA
jgi:ATP-dependent DNA ligase